MTFRFINMFWSLLALAALPLLVHLFARTRPPVVKFSSVIFLRRVVRNTMRARKPKDWLVLLLRTLAVTALILMVLRPVLFADARWINPGVQRQVVLVIDRSTSMGYNEGGRTRFASACAEASEILAGLAAGDTADIVWIDAEPEAVFPTMGVNFGFLRDTLRKARVSDQPGASAEALRVAQRLLDGCEGRREIHLISDFQRSGWDNFRSQLPPDIAFYAIPAAQADAVNVAVTELRTRPSKALPNEAVDAVAEVSNFSGEPQQAVVYLTFGEIRKQQDVVIPARGRSSLLFHLAAAEKGDNLLSAALEADGDKFAADNRRYGVLTVQPHISVGITEPMTASSKRFARALKSLPWVKESVLPANSTVGADLPDVSFMPQVAADDKRLQQLLAGGRTVIWTPPIGTRSVDLKAFYGDNPAESGVPLAQEKGEFRLKVANAEDPMLRIFKEGRYGDPAAGIVKKRLNLSPLPAEKGTSILSYQDGVPAICISADKPNLILWNLPLDPKLSSFSDQITYVPFIGELLLRQREKALYSAAGRFFTCGDRVRRSFSRAYNPENISLKDSDGKGVDLRHYASKNETDIYASEAALPAGVYRWHSGPERPGLSVVNFPTAESDLRTLTKSEIEAMGAHQVDDVRAMRNLSSGREIWHLLLLAAILAILGELAVIYIFERKK